MRKMSRSGVWFISVLLCCLLVFASIPVDTLAQNKKKEKKLPAVAITQPTINKNIEDHLREHIDLVILLSRMESSLHETRKFRVLTRDKEDMEKVRTEQKFSKSDLTDGNAALPGKLQNANFIVNVKVEDFAFYRKTQPMPNVSGKFFRTDVGSMDVNIEIIDTESGELKGSFIVEDGFNTGEQVVNTRGGEPSSSHYTDMAESISADFADQFLATVFPMKVINVASGQIYINRGQDGGLEEGDKLKVFRTGKKLRDPSTGKVLGTTEVEIGMAKVKRVNPKFTIAEMIDVKDGKSVKKGYILRKP